MKWSVSNHGVGKDYLKKWKYNIGVCYTEKKLEMEVEK